MLGGGSSVASAFLAKLGGGANVPATNGPTAPASILSLVKVGPLPMSKVWAFRRQSPSQPAAELGIQLNRSCVVTKVIPGSFADDAHVTSGLIVAKVNDNLVKTEAEFIAHVQRSVDCCILFFEGDAVTELITQVMNATYDAQGIPNEPPFAQLLAENPARYGFLSVSHPLHLHWRDRVDETRKARDALRAMELGDDEEQRQKDEKKRAALAAEIDNLDDLLASDKDDDAPAPAHSAVARRDDMSHQQQQQQQPTYGRKPAGRSSMFEIDDGVDEPQHAAGTYHPYGGGAPHGSNDLAAVIDTMASDLSTGRSGPVLATPPPAASDADMDLLRNAIFANAPPEELQPPPTTEAPVTKAEIEPIRIPLPGPPPYAGAPLSATPSFINIPMPMPMPQPVFFGGITFMAIPRMGPKPAPPPGPPPARVQAAHYAQYEPEPRRLSPKRVRRDICQDFRRGKCNRPNCVFEHIGRERTPPRAPEREREREREREAAVPANYRTGGSAPHHGRGREEEPPRAGRDDSRYPPPLADDTAGRRDDRSRRDDPYGGRSDRDGDRRREREPDRDRERDRERGHRSGGGESRTGYDSPPSRRHRDEGQRGHRGG
jgi:hypothetical protein